VLHHHLGLRAREIADLLGIPEGTVVSRLHYGSRALRIALDPELAPAGGQP
jgi:RNA polymerase sigma-70 factor (ECF subfamily)